MLTSPDASTDHARVIAFLARKTTMPIDEVTQLYEREWAALEATTRLQGYVPSLTFGHVRRLLRKIRNKIPTPGALPSAVPAATSNSNT
jgi:hypothetical protein